MATTADQGQNQVRQWLEHVRLELVPEPGYSAELAAVPEGSTVTLRCPSRQAIGAVVEAARVLRTRGYVVVPHVPARFLRDEAEVMDLYRTLGDLGIDEWLVVGGETQDVEGDFGDALSLLRLIHDRISPRPKLGIAAYPEGHPRIRTTVLEAALHEKAALADYLVTQVSYSGERIARWLGRIRSQGVALPAYVGIPGAQDAYTPRALLDELATRLGANSGVSGVQVATLNHVADTEAWRRTVLA